MQPKYQGQQQAMAHGEVIEAAVSEVRHWNRKQSDTIIDRYEIIALAPNPNTGNAEIRQPADVGRSETVSGRHGKSESRLVESKCLCDGYFCFCRSKCLDYPDHITNAMQNTAWRLLFTG